MSLKYEPASEPLHSVNLLAAFQGVAYLRLAIEESSLSSLELSDTKVYEPSTRKR